ncbi:NodT family efflux transporter outer membrane factor (OMF) lipoprotein [Zymomonas mobilis]|uniref:efflux transporter outer membrane subunit n=1 Tax=Zymomonas mobilis TaxID=542 RepID=UPI00026D7EA8|nr:efflux transporter outer membrane subunit [Zymomonas mobilis]AFN57431.1 RND efflux system, outer membrane lipoprotein, NodT family [Zymomonas mobilis subsp. mobilis ATCC 29191]TQK78807.1 NodT family efflux transporter outer membrane factor (OMF) lipoprotein [Zymomonas mobilis]TQL15991.1 NodT family efflux transporter outer membrane factor (OMF) lipoprotein [Zymomonas mobilis]
MKKKTSEMAFFAFSSFSSLSPIRAVISTKSIYLQTLRYKKNKGSSTPVLNAFYRLTTSSGIETETLFQSGTAAKPYSSMADFIQSENSIRAGAVITPKGTDVSSFKETLDISHAVQTGYIKAACFIPSDISGLGKSIAPRSIISITTHLTVSLLDIKGRISSQRQDEEGEKIAVLPLLPAEISKRAKVEKSMTIFPLLKSGIKLSHSCRSHHFVKASPITASQSQTKIPTPYTLEISGQPQIGNSMKASFSLLPPKAENSVKASSLSVSEVGNIAKSSSLPSSKVGNIEKSSSIPSSTVRNTEKSSCLLSSKVGNTVKTSSLCLSKMRKTATAIEKTARTLSLSPSDVAVTEGLSSSSPVAGKAIKATPSSPLEVEKSATAYSLSAPEVGAATKETASSPLEAGKISLSAPEVGKTTKVIPTSSSDVRKNTKAFFLSSSEIKKSVKALFLLPPLALVLAGCEVGPDYVRPSAPTPHQYSGADNNKVTNVAGNRGATGATLSSSKAASDPKKSADAKSDQKKSATENNPPLPPDQITPSGQKISWQEAQPMDRQIKDRWWELFNDPELNKLIERSDVASQSVAQAEATWRNALAVMGQNRSSMWPTISLSASNQHTVTGGGSEVVNTAGGGSSTVSRSNISDNYRAGLSMSWTPDFFGGVRRQIENSRATAEANMADIETARLALHAGVASSYLQLREADAEIAVMEQTIAAYTHALEVARNRFNAGIAPESDVFQAETQLSNTRSQIESLRQNRRTYEDAISVYVGIPAGDFHIEPRNDWSPVFPDVPLDLPSTLLQRRPDIASAERKIEAASATIGVRKAAFYPSFSMSPYAGDTAGDITRLLAQSSSIWSVGASMAFTVLDWGSHLSQLHQARAAYSQAVANYRQVVLQAYQNVADEIAATQIYGNQETHLNDAFKNADRSEQATLKRYQVGLVAYTDVVTVETSALSAKRSLMQTQLARQTAAVSLIQALGGGWTGLPPRMPPNHKVFHEAKKQRLADEKAEKAIAEKQKTRP